MRCLAEREGRVGVACVLLIDMLDDFLVIVFATGQSLIRIAGRSLVSANDSTARVSKGLR